MAAETNCRGQGFFSYNAFTIIPIEACYYAQSRASHFLPFSTRVKLYNALLLSHIDLLLCLVALM